MMKNNGSLFSLATLAAGAIFIGKLIHDVKKIKRLTEEKEEAIAEDAEIIPAEEEIAEEIAEEEPVAEEAVEEPAEEPVAEETAVEESEEAPVEEATEVVAE